MQEGIEGRLLAVATTFRGDLTNHLRDFSFLSAEHSTSVQLIGVDVEPRYGPNGAPNLGWWYSQIPGVVVISDGSEILRRTFPKASQTHLETRFTKKEGQDDHSLDKVRSDVVIEIAETDNVVLAAARRFFREKVRDYLGLWGEQEGQCQEIVDLISRLATGTRRLVYYVDEDHQTRKMWKGGRAIPIPVPYAVRNPVYTGLEANLEEFRPPKVEGNEFRYSVAGDVVYGVLFNTQYEAKLFAAEALHILMHSYGKRMAEVARAEARNKVVRVNVRDSTGGMVTIEEFDDGPVRTLHLANCAPFSEVYVHLRIPSATQTVLRLAEAMPQEVYGHGEGIPKLLERVGINPNVRVA